MNTTHTQPLHPVNVLMGVDVGIWWYADYPSHYCGDGIPATVEKGNNWLDARAHAFAKVIRAIKADTETKRLQDEFFGRAETF